MRARHHVRRVVTCATALIGATVLTAGAHADLFDHYGNWFRTVPQLMADPGSFGVAIDAMPDGRLVATTGSSVLLESAAGSNVFRVAAIIDASLLPDPVDPGFIAVSPTGSRLAIGAGFNKPILVFDSALLNPTAPTALTPANATAFEVTHFAAAWLDDVSLAVTGGVFGQPSFVTMLDTTSSPAAPDNPIVIANIGGASGGVAIDHHGAIFTGNGFDLSPGEPGTSETGWIKRFTAAEWSSGADFENDGQFVADLLSANTLAFDRNGALAVGGGDFDGGDVGTIAIIRADALATLIQSDVPIQTNDPSQVRRLDPLGTGGAFYNALFNPGTDEFLITDFGGWFATSGRRTGDLNGDDRVDGDDLAALLRAFGQTDVFADLNHDGVVNGADVASLLANWGGPTP